ncbi:DUF567 domain protein [Teratosphaeria destructans]|uniref:DUF567 domain protein n=1 Tax=Teratosphaeria destructans TaxID=418781 RepID=A0A9W7SYL5_9PEZI|nr:DUF567 domain protein [Teratosphaeria destructans]
MQLFHIDGKFWSLSQRKHFKDMSGTILFEIRKRHLRWPRCWYIQKGDKRLAWVKGRVGSESSIAAWRFLFPKRVNLTESTVGHRHSRIHFTNTAGDGKDIELHLRGHYFAGRGAKLYLGPDASASLPVPSSGVAGPPSDSSPVSAFSGPPAAPDIMIAEIEPQDVMGPKARLTGKDTYKMTVAKNFDLALACIICVAVDERRTDNSQRSRNLNSVLHGHLPTG